MSIAILPIVFFFLLLITAVPVIIGIYVYRDARSRGMDALLWTLLAVFAPGFIGLIIYLIMRRDHVSMNCPQCGSEVQPSFVSCPSCGQKLCASCMNCGSALQPEWKLCPQCGAEITQTSEFAPPVVAKPQTKGLGWAIGVVLALPVAFVLLTVVCFIGLRAYTYNVGSEPANDSEYVAQAQIALQEFSKASHYIDLEVLTLDEAKPDKEALDWVKAKQKGKEGIYSKTFFQSENGSINSDQGSGSYALTYAYTVVVINPQSGEKYDTTGHSFTHCTDVENALLIENLTVTLAPVQDRDTESPDYGNVFVIKHAERYSFDYQGKEDNSPTYYEETHQVFKEFTNENGEVVMQEVYDYSDKEPYCIDVELISGYKDAKYKIPVRYDGEYFSTFK